MFPLRLLLKLPLGLGRTGLPKAKSSPRKEDSDFKGRIDEAATLLSFSPSSYSTPYVPSALAREIVPLVYLSFPMKRASTRVPTRNVWLPSALSDFDSPFASSLGEKSCTFLGFGSLSLSPPPFLPSDRISSAATPVSFSPSS
ncbi:hypothetical protein PC129_g4358 [Phytophthora cactorum]|uniref:Uncharacterized protein n=1 Tax=Phytophthora cactorum TaxID=29920 RepID=A0A8T1IPW9_9STRA|nr:hypothetical protein PC128_g14942 [Phytophthora cactorum]KAG3224982.1 hypothetical protein PC129_g4358 [Phytophthora cactorum]